MWPNGRPWEGADREGKGPEMEPWVSSSFSLSRRGGACKGAWEGVASELGRKQNQCNSLVICKHRGQEKEVLLKAGRGQVC